MFRMVNVTLLWHRLGGNHKKKIIMERRNVHTYIGTLWMPDSTLHLKNRAGNSSSVPNTYIQSEQTALENITKPVAGRRQARQTTYIYTEYIAVYGRRQHRLPSFLWVVARGGEDQVSAFCGCLMSLQNRWSTSGKQCVVRLDKRLIA